MELIPIDSSEARTLVQKRGRTGEHNIDWILNIARGEEVASHVAALDDKRAAVVHDYGTEWEMREEPLAATEDLASTVCDLAQQLLTEKPEVEKITVELKTGTRKEVSQKLSPILHARRINYTMDWPVYDLVQFDPTLPGKQWKHLRNTRNAFERNHRTQVVDAREVEKEKLHALVRGWRKDRPKTNRTYDGRYHAMIDSGFTGFGSARAMFVDDTLAGINGGWPFPGKPDCWYGSVGLHDFAFKDIGEILYLEDMRWCKEQGWKFVDMAGGEGGLTRFKAQFHPTHWYKTHVFSIGRV